MSKALRDRYDVVIAGARCAGASTALLLARMGADVLVVDPLPRGRDTLSTHALMRAGVLQLHRWGVLSAVRGAGTPDILSTTFHYADESITVPIKDRDGVSTLAAPRRTVLDPILVTEAERSGAQVMHGWAVTDLVMGAGGRVEGAVVADASGETRAIRADMVIGADGIRSKVARLVEAPVVREGRHATASIYGYWPEFEDSGFQWYFRADGGGGSGGSGGGSGIGTIPTNGREACVFVSVSPKAARKGGRELLTRLYREAVRDHSSALFERLEGLGEGPRLRAFPGMPGFIRRSVGPGWALVGDASMFRDPLTAHGITDALRDAEWLARAVASGSAAELQRYEEERAEVIRGVWEVTDQIAALDWTDGQVQGLHMALSRAMNESVHLIRSWGPAPGRGEVEAGAEAEVVSAGAAGA